MARERSIVVRLRAEVSDFQRQMGAAGRSLTDFEQAQQRMGGAATTTMGRMVQSARANEREWTMVGKSLLAVGGSITAMGGALLGTGIQYNALRQKATQALTAVTGSTSDAAEQMRRLDEYGQNSWLMRDTLIRAQQTMTGFGIETSKVIPYMDALAEATAATGGSNQDFEELALLMGQIQSQGKITATELMRFGVRGVDAAQLIGDAMGMTAGEIRESITAGTLDAGTALDALAQGMKERYNGASDLVRDTFEGAFADVKAAFRDLGAELATPLVNPEGGGLLVDWLNSLADAMRAFRDAPGWVKNAVAGLGGLTAAVTLGAGAFMVGLPRYVEFRDALTTLGNAHPALGRLNSRLGGMVSTMSRWAMRAGVAAVAANVLGRAAQGIQESIYGAALGMNEMNRVLAQGNYDQAFAHLTGGYNSFEEALNTLTGSGLFEKLDRGLSTVNQALGGALPDDVQGAANAFASMGDALASMVQSGNADDAAAQFEMLAAAAAAHGVSTEQLLDLMPSYRDALVGLEDGAYGASDGMSDLAVGTSDAQAAMEEAREANQKLREEIHQSVGGLVDWTGGIDAADFSLRDWTQSLEDQIEKLRNFDSNMATVSDRVSEFAGEGAAQQVAQQLIEMGDTGVAAAAALAAAGDGDFQAAIEALLGLEDQAGETSSSLADLAAPEINVDTSVATGQLVAWQLAMAAMGVDVEVSPNTEIATTQMIAWRIGQELMNIEVDVDADTTGADAEIAETTDVDPVVIDLQSDAALANEELNGFYDDAAALDPTMHLDADTDPADGSLAKWVGSVDKTTATADLDADDADAQGVLTGFSGSAARARPIVPLGADDKSARTTTSVFTRWAGGQNPKVKVGANDSSGRTATGRFTTWVGRQNPKAKVGAKDTSARATTNDFTRWVGRRKPSMGLRATSKAAKATVSDFSRWAARKTPSMALRASTAGATKTVNNWLAAQRKKSATVSIFAKTKSGFAGGGPVHGPGSGTSDSIAARLSNGEHVWTAREVAAAGGHGAIMAMRQAVLSGAVRGFANGGAVESTRYVVPNVTVAAPAPAATAARQYGMYVDKVNITTASSGFSLEQVRERLRMAGAS